MSDSVREKERVRNDRREESERLGESKRKSDRAGERRRKRRSVEVREGES